MTAEIGHNGGPTFDDIVRDNMDRGLLLTMKETIVTAVRDPRLDRRHLRVLAEVIACINSESGQAYPSRKAIAEATRRYEAVGVRETQGYSESGINKTLSELVSYGYLVSTKRAVEHGGRALSIYSIRRPTMEELQDQITAWIDSVRSAPRKPVFTHVGKDRTAPDVTPVGKDSHPDFTSVGKDIGKVSPPTPDFTHVGKDTPPDVTPVGKDRGSDFTPVGNFTPVGKDRADFTSDFTYVVPTVTSRETICVSVGGARAHEGDDPGQGQCSGEEHIAHGVFVNGETIRHANFAISLPGIRMGTLNSGMTATEVKDACVAHALQWAAEIENGTAPDKAVPSKVANFLCRSIMHAVNQGKVQAVREQRERQWTPKQVGRAASGPTSDQPAPAESRQERIARQMREAAQAQGGKP